MSLSMIVWLSAERVPPLPWRGLNQPRYLGRGRGMGGEVSKGVHKHKIHRTNGGKSGKGLTLRLPRPGEGVEGRGTHLHPGSPRSPIKFPS